MLNFFNLQVDQVTPNFKLYYRPTDIHTDKSIHRGAPLLKKRRKELPVENLDLKGATAPDRETDRNAKKWETEKPYDRETMK